MIPIREKHISMFADMPLCQCGCGNRVRRKESRFLRGHSSRTPEARKAIGDKRRGVPLSTKHRKKLSESHMGNVSGMKGKHHTEESKVKMGRKGRKMSADSCRKMSESRKGHLVSRETRRRISDATRGRRSSMEGRKHSDSTKEKMRISTLRRLSEQCFNGEPMVPCVGYDERAFLDDVQRFCPFVVERQFQVSGYFLDGYIREICLGIEFDEAKHRRKKMRAKDKEREMRIIERLGCIIWRVSRSEWLENPQAVLDDFRKIQKAA